jgi:hypothetical protein
MHRTQHPTVSAADTDGVIAVSPAGILRGAARYLEVHGWTQHVYYGGTPADAFPPACADGAIGIAAYGRKAGFPGETQDPAYRDYNRALDYFCGYLEQTGANPTCGLSCSDGTDCWCGVNDAADDPFGWNDKPGQTAGTVIATLLAAADEYDWQHAAEDDLETYADACVWNETHPTREGFLAWLGAR